MTGEKILDIEEKLQALSEEMLRLKSASENYEDTKEKLQKMCEALDNISQTNRNLAEKMSSAIADMEKTILENKKTQEFIQNRFDEAKRVFETESKRHEAFVEASLSDKFNEIKEESRQLTEKVLRGNADLSATLNQIKEIFEKQVEEMHKDNVKQHKSLTILKGLSIIGIVIGVVIIIRLLLF